MARKTQSIRHPLFFSPFLPSRGTATQPMQFFILSQSGERRSLNRRAGQGRPYPKTDRKGDTLGAINLGQRSYRRVGHSHLQGARKRQADHDDGARQYADRDQSAFAVASHNKRAHPWLNGEPHRQRDNLLNRPEVGKRRLSMTTPPAKRVYPSSPKSGRRATGVSFKRPLKLAHCCFILATKDLPPASGVLPSGPGSDVSLGL